MIGKLKCGSGICEKMRNFFCSAGKELNMFCNSDLGDSVTPYLIVGSMRSRVEAVKGSGKNNPTHL